MDADRSGDATQLHERKDRAQCVKRCQEIERKLEELKKGGAARRRSAAVVAEETEPGKKVT
jgi:hypothetical protein